jgi:arabinoxylan arabinofuranohydrolase
MASCGGVEYEDFTNIKKNTRISTLGNDATENMQVRMNAGSWINVRKVDYGEDGAATFTLRAKGTGKMELRNGSSPRSTVTTIEFSSTEMEDQTFDLPADKLKGVKNNLYLVVTEATDFYVDAWQFTAYNPTGIQKISNHRHTSSNPNVYDLSGRRVNGHSKGIRIVNGKKVVNN